MILPGQYKISALASYHFTDHLKCTTVRATMAARSLRIESSVWGHHIYKEVWTPSIGEELQTAQEPENGHDPYAVAVLKEES